MDLRRIIFVACFLGAINVIGISAMPVTQGFECPTQYGLYPDPANCSNFYQCSQGISYLKTCQEGLYFNPGANVCDWPENVPCGQISPSEISPSEISSSAISPSEESQNTGEVKEETTDSSVGLSSTGAPTVSYTFTCPEQFGLYQDQYDCSRYWHCSYGIAYHMYCPDNLYYNPEKEQCDWKENVKSGCVALQRKRRQVEEGNVVDGTDNIEGSGETEFMCPEDDGMFSDPETCTRFYHCANGLAYHMVCPSGLHFNQVSLQCDWADQAGCEEQSSGDLSELEEATTEASEPTTPTLVKTTYKDARDLGFKCPKPDGLFSHLEDCSKFYQCSNGVAYLMDCPNKLLFNHNTGYCDWPENVQCVLPQL